MEALIIQNNVIHLFRVSDKEFGEEICRILIEIKESMNQPKRTTNRNQENMKIKIIKLQTIITGLKTLVIQMKSSGKTSPTE